MSETDGKVHDFRNSYLVANFYDLRELGNGAYGNVRLKQDKKDKKWYAIKTILMQGWMKVLLERYQEFSRDLHHENIVRVYDVWAEEIAFTKFLYIQMEFCSGGSVRDRIGSQQIKNAEIWPLVEGCLKGLEYLHSRGLLHRDITPNNIVLSKEGITKFTDFDMVIASQASLTAGVGTQQYQAPEVRACITDYTQKVDIYSLGLVFFECFLSMTVSEGERSQAMEKIRLADRYVKLAPSESLPENVCAAAELMIRAMLFNAPRRRPTASKLLQALEFRVLCQNLINGKQLEQLSRALLGPPTEKLPRPNEGEDDDYVTVKKTIYGQAPYEPREGQIAVAWVIKNRAEANRDYWGGSRLKDVCRHSDAFACWRGNEDVHIGNPTLYAAIDEFLPGVLDGSIPDPTNGADHFLNHENSGYPLWQAVIRF